MLANAGVMVINPALSGKLPHVTLALSPSPASSRGRIAKKITMATSEQMAISKNDRPHEVGDFPPLKSSVQPMINGPTQLGSP
ncbi:MAG: hypothetical protein EB072_15000 [Betaproteobacteria bacterium]|nr:hypothetical protein [Betaproteobacteria bacterium]